MDWAFLSSVKTFGSKVGASGCCSFWSAISQSFLPQMDDLWHCQSIDEEQEKVVLVNIHTDQVYDLYFDNLIEFRNPDRFLLKSQLTLSGNHIFETPLF